MQITEIGNDERHAFLDLLLLLGDEQPEMVEKYIDKGRMFVLYDDACARPAGEAVVIKLHDGAFEIKTSQLTPASRKGATDLPSSVIFRIFAAGKGTV